MAVTVRRVGEDLVDHLLVERFGPAEIALVSQPGSELEQRRPEVDDLLARRVESNIVVDGCTDRARGARTLWLFGELSFKQIFSLTRDLHSKARRRSVVLAMIDEPGAVGRTVRVEDQRRTARTPKQVFDAHGVGADPVGEPGRVWNLVEAVHVDRLAVLDEPDRLGEWAEKHVIRPVPDERRYVNVGCARDVMGIFRCRGLAAC